jgi:hypothetical protein
MHFLNLNNSYNFYTFPAFSFLFTFAALNKKNAVRY